MVPLRLLVLDHQLPPPKVGRAVATAASSFPSPSPDSSSVHFLPYSESIPYHSDDAAFGEHIRVFCFGDERPIRFRRRVIKKEEGTQAETVELHRFSKPVGSRDCYELSGEARHLWQHSVSEGRGKRISVTFRSKA